MKKLAATSFFLISFFTTYPQQEILIYKKKHRSIEKFWKGSIISFQVDSKQWRKGEITRIHNDSFYIRPNMVTYSLYGTDTTYFPVEGYTVDDIYAMPKKGVLISYKNGSYQVSKSGGHVHWYWIKNGLLFRYIGGAYAVLSIATGNVVGIGIGTAIFVGGFIMGKLYKPAVRIRKKFRVETLKLYNYKIAGQWLLTQLPAT